MVEPFPPDTPLLSFSPSKKDSWTLQDAYEGVQIFGALGSGKTSGSGQVIATSFLAAGFGGLVLTAKPDERELWERYARATGREKDIIVFSPNQPHGFNFLAYEMKRPGRGAGDTANLIKLFRYVLDTSQQQTTHEPYWDNALNQLLRNAIDITTAATGTIHLQAIRDIIKTAPLYPEQLENPDWLENSFCLQSIRVAIQNDQLSPQHRRDVEAAADYWTREFPALAEKTRSIIVSMFTSLADQFLRGAMFDLFCDKLTIVPEMTETGKIIILDLPVKEYGESGRLAQIVFKYLWQQAIERRDVKKSPRPVFLWADEAQNFCAAYDMQFQATARSSKACTVYLTQNVPLYYAAFGSGEKGKNTADALLGNLQTKIFHANGDTVTNNYAAEIIGKTWQLRVGTSMQLPDRTQPNTFNQSSQTSASTNEAYEFEIVPREFTSLRKGGAAHNLTIDAFVFEGGRVWSSGKNYLRTSFIQQRL